MDNKTKQRYYTIINNLDGLDYLLSVVSYNVAPTINDEKPSSLISFTVKRKNLFKLWNMYKEEVCNHLNLKYYVIKEKDNKVLVLFYKSETLKNHLKDDEYVRFLKNLGYTARMSLDDKLHYLKERFKIINCPHEVGIFLGIPIEDVESFIENNGEGYIFYRYWKVYHNSQRAREIFDRYDNHRATMVKDMEKNYYPI
ncbi:uncharacterized protein DUF3793 [Natranaerovirga hydrolytica]|uniref:Uncharacterized protein DUF3793 n=1 Tax=Natranaerovirga hydrolytica TaxID=680378 RepID=A0A4R1MQJ8_9FIRM|nr:DUF3793 family protein [Natranaerovirga hydrolytica]TCK92809.1 uncharacterized protein DUF3793 [Natranaerovirga hydrolytica]